jgi:formylglycine-generating enzyme required for sulfatase activity
MRLGVVATALVLFGAGCSKPTSKEKPEKASPAQSTEGVQEKSRPTVKEVGQPRGSADANGRPVAVTPAAPTPLGTEVYQGWPFDGTEAKRRQRQTAERLGTTVEMALDSGNGVKMEMVLIPAGRFMMGSPETEKDRGDDEPLHEVTLTKPYWMGKYEVTQEQYQQVMGRNPAQFKGARNPVETISWDDAQEFCRKLSQQTSRQIRLPTEAEWEHACRAGTSTPFNTGETISTDLANYDGRHTYGNGTKGENRNKTIPVGSLYPNAFGLYDMHGNVMEWCQDLYSYLTKDSVRDPQGPTDRLCRVLRDGGYCTYPKHFRSARRWGDNEANQLRGFRVAASVPPKAP